VSTGSSHSTTRTKERRHRGLWPATRRARLSRGRALLVVTGLVLAFLAHRPTSPRVEASQLSASNSATCEANIEGWRFPTAVPSYLQWEPVLAALAVSDDTVTRALNVGAATLAQVKAAALSGTARAKQLRSMSSSDVGAAAAILNSRDELIRQLPEATFDDLQAIVWKRAEATAYKLPAPGKRTTGDAISRCRVEADFTKQPHLVPEYIVWNMYFDAKAHLAAENRLIDGSYPDSFIAGTRFGLRIQPSSMISLFDVASAAAAEVEVLRSQEAVDRQVESAVMSRRAQLIRTLPPRDWAEIKAAVAHIGVRYFFPSTW
jgi:hypothetical protein